MKISEVIERLSKIESQHGDVEVNVYLSYSKETRGFTEIQFDDELKDAYIGVYG